MIDVVADQQIKMASPATLRFQYEDQDGFPADPGTVTVSVASSDGTAVLTGQATAGTGTAERTVDLTAAQTAAIDRLTATWSNDTPTVIGATVVDVVGRWIVGLEEFRQDEPLSDADKAEFIRARNEVDHFIRGRCHRSFVKRFDTETINSNGSKRLRTRVPDVKSVLWANDEDGNAITITSAVPRDSGFIDLNTGWPCGRITVGYVHGVERPPDDIAGAAAALIDHRNRSGHSLLSGAASNLTTPLGSTSFTPIAGYGKALTAISEIDEALNAHRWEPPLVR